MTAIIRLAIDSTAPPYPMDTDTANDWARFCYLSYFALCDHDREAAEKEIGL